MNTIVLTVEGGVVQSVHSDQAVQVVILDHDCDVEGGSVDVVTSSSMENLDEETRAHIEQVLPDIFPDSEPLRLTRVSQPRMIQDEPDQEEARPTLFDMGAYQEPKQLNTMWR